MRKLDTPGETIGAPQVYKFDKVPTWLKFTVGFLAGLVAAMALWTYHLQQKIETNNAMWFVTARELAELKGRSE
jgi:hypothetical protein